MIRHIRTLAASAVALAGGLAAYGQASVIILGPTNQAGPVTFYKANFSATASPWGFGNPDTARAVVGFGQIALPDTAFCTNNGVTAGSLRGKIAFIRRSADACGTVPPGTAISTNARNGARALKAQRAGAIGVVIVDVQPGLASASVPQLTVDGGPAAGDSGSRVTIPVTAIPDSVFQRLKPSLVAGTCSLLIGSLHNYFPNNLTVDGKNIAIPNQLYTPYFELKDENVIRFKPVMVASNVGSANAVNVKYKCVINQLTPNFQQLYADSVTHASVPSTRAAIVPFDSTTTMRDTLAGFRVFSRVPGSIAYADRAAYKGDYEIVYSAFANGVADDYPSDNVVRVKFAITDSTKAAGRLTPDALEEPYTGAHIIGTTGGGPIKAYILQQQPEDVVSYATSVAGRVTYNSTTGSIVGESVYGELNEWDDANSDGLISDDEITNISQSVLDFTDDSQTDHAVNLKLFDPNSSNVGAPMLPGHNYLLGINYSGNAEVVIYVDDFAPTFLRRFTPGSLPLNVANSSGGNWFFGVTDSQASVKGGINFPTLGTKPSVGTIEALTAYPNPATDALRVNVVDKKGAGKAILTVTDLAGHTLQTEEVSLAGRVTTHKLSTASMAAGLYQLTVKTEGGQRTIRFAVGR